MERTLSDEDIKSAMSSIEEVLKEKLGLELR